MKAIWLTCIAVCTAVLGIARAHEATPVLTAATAPSHKVPPHGPCLLGINDCLGLSTIPATPCPVTKGRKLNDACAVGGMKLIGKLTV
jgi:hypothetical protein